eukprot:2741270-Rhodomonas_salina.1
MPESARALGRRGGGRSAERGVGAAHQGKQAGLQRCPRRRRRQRARRHPPPLALPSPPQRRARPRRC